MIGWLRGEILGLETSGLVILNVNGVGYEIHISLQALCEFQQGQEAEFLIHTHVREDQITLFGFSLAGERNMFRKLMTISGIGARVAMNILSGMSVDDLSNAIQSSDDAFIARIPGIGKKTAQRLILELKGKLITEPGTAPGSSLPGDVRSALINLGYKPASIDAAMNHIAPSGDFETMFKSVMKAIS